jgi:hypothetical protein
MIEQLSGMLRFLFNMLPQVMKAGSFVPMCLYRGCLLFYEACLSWDGLTSFWLSCSNSRLSDCEYGIILAYHQRSPIYYPSYFKHSNMLLGCNRKK